MTDVTAAERHRTRPLSSSSDVTAGVTSSVPRTTHVVMRTAERSGGAATCDDESRDTRVINITVDQRAKFIVVFYQHTLHYQ